MVVEKSPLHSKPLNERYRLWVLKKSIFLKTNEDLGDIRCLGKPRKSFVGHPNAILFSQISREGVFQQPRLLSTLYFRFSRDTPLTGAFRVVWG